MITNLLLDVDGVLADFTTAACKAHGTTVEYVLSHSAPGTWNMIQEALGLTEAEFWAPLNAEGFWYTVRPYHGARRFFDALDHEVSRLCDISFCTMPGGYVPNFVDARQQLLREITGHTNPRAYYCCGASKNPFASASTLLVDDRDKNVNEFREHGGAAVLVPMRWNRGWMDNNRNDPHYEMLLEDILRVINHVEDDGK